jgi:hypothetical protein
MLSGVEKDFVMMLPQRPADGCCLDELGARPDDRQDLQREPSSRAGGADHK